MSRVINPDSVGKERTRLTKSIVLCMREMMKMAKVTPEAKDMASFIALALQSISEGVDVSVDAWEKRDYWVKSEELRQRWMWVGDMADQLRAMIYADQWTLLPPMMLKLLPKVADIKITKMTRDVSLWDGVYDTLMKEKPAK